MSAASDDKNKKQDDKSASTAAAGQKVNETSKSLSAAAEVGYTMDLEYWRRCRDYLGSRPFAHEEIERKHPETSWPEANVTRSVYEDVLVKAHKYKNRELLENKKFPGCGRVWEDDDALRGPDDGCEWTAYDNRCSCGNYKGFVWNDRKVDWITDIHLDSENYVGYQEALWPCG